MVLRYPYVLDDELFPAGKDPRSVRKFRMLQDVWEHREQPEQSRFFREQEEEIQRQGYVRHKRHRVRSRSELQQFIREYFLDMLYSMQRDGYLPDKTSHIGTGGHGTAFIDARGRLVKSSGADHRFAAAVLAGVDRGFPLEVIGIHRRWLEQNGVAPDSRGAVGQIVSLIRRAEQEHQ